MIASALSVAALLLMGTAILLIPLGLPGLWIMLAVATVATLVGPLSWLSLVLLLGVVLAAEGIEFLLLARMGRRFGGSGRAFLGAVAGGILGAFAGAPVPVLGSVLFGLVGTFAGAAAVTLVETRSLRDGSRVGAGVLVARILATVVKCLAALILLGVAAAGLLS